MTYDNIQKEYSANAERLAEQVRAFYPDAKVVKGEDRCDFSVILKHGGQAYRVNKGYDGNITIHRQDWGQYPNVSSQVRGEIYTAHKLGNMKVLTAKKIQERVDAEEAYHADMAKAEAEHAAKVSEFMKTLVGLPVRYSEDKKRGDITTNGIRFSFEILQSGYIHKELRLDYGVDANALNFTKLAANHY